MVNVTGWSRGLEVTAGGTGVVSHAGLALLRQLADKTGLTEGLSAALASGRLLVHDRGRVLADLPAGARRARSRGVAASLGLPPGHRGHRPRDDADVALPAAGCSWPCEGLLGFGRPHHGRPHLMQLMRRDCSGAGRASPGVQAVR
jgi:hypothetical protein